jgi:two-component system response regulator HydG
MQTKVLVVEDDMAFSKLLEGFLKRHGYEPEIHHRLKDGIKAFDSKAFDVLLLDYRLPDGTGMEMLQHIRQTDADFPVVIMTSFNDIRTAVSAMRSGAIDYIVKPVNPDELLMTIKQAVIRQPGLEPTPKAVTADWVQGESIAATRMEDHIRLIAPTDMSVIIQGESGTGKEYVARSIHAQSKRAGQPFVAIDCGALSPELAASELFGHAKGAFTGALTDKSGQFEQANGGTLFLDEVGNLSYEVQVKLLRALQERMVQPVGSNKQIKVDVRIITATNDDLMNSVRNGRFREDIYHRLNEFKIKTPPLRERAQDLELFSQHFMQQANDELGRNVKEFTPEVLDIFRRYTWPGNLRELKNIIKRAVLLTPGTIAGKEVLPDEMMWEAYLLVENNQTNLKAIQEEQEKSLIVKTLEQVRYNKSKAALLLNIDRKTLYNKITRYGIES